MTNNFFSLQRAETVAYSAKAAFATSVWKDLNTGDVAVDFPIIYLHLTQKSAMHACGKSKKGQAGLLSMER
jgi:hypothetical protein